LAKIQANDFLFGIRKWASVLFFIFVINKIKMVVTENKPVTMTEGAIRQIRRLMEQEGFDASQKLRVGVKGGGCSGMSYVLGFDHPTEKDKAFEIEGIRLHHECCT
jgi:16S rRNA U516 pseudouridylate synthase RsuA-like enzyme